MRIRHQTDNNIKDALYAILALTGIFVLLELGYLIQCNRVYLSDFNHITADLTLPATILPGILSLILIQACLHLLFALFIWLMTVSLVYALPDRRLNMFNLAIQMTLFGLISMLVANQVYFPNSKFSDLISIILPFYLADKVLMVILLAWSLLLTVVATYYVRHLRNKPFIYMPVIVFIAANVYLFNHSTQRVVKDAASIARPNIIIIGMDSIRPDFLSFFGNEHPTPFIDSFLQNASISTDAITPLARTYPSWVSILTGRHPKQTGARSNLGKFESLHYENSLPEILQKVGYETIYGTDETRFNNIDINYGFNKAITPPIGLNDFLIGSVNDFPFSNFLINTQLGKWIFPYNYANRPAYATYNPKSFISLLNDNITSERDKPLFLAVHFCLAHYPYLYASVPASQLGMRELYVNSIAGVDLQIKDFFRLLEQKQLLDHAIVILLSDHGEALELAGDRVTESDLFIHSGNKKQTVPHFYPVGQGKDAMNESDGHGTDVLGLPQYHSLLAFKVYGSGKQQIGMIPGVISLLDIKPTILDMISVRDKQSIKSTQNGKGMSLAPLMRNALKHLPARHLFIETDFTPDAMRTAYPNAADVVLEGIDILEVDPSSTRLTVKAPMQKMIIGSKQYADIYQHWMLALYPRGNNAHVAILVNLLTGEWTNDFRSSFALHSPAILMQHQLKAFYGDELKEVSI